MELRGTSVGQLSRTPEQQETSFMELNCKVCSTSLPEPHPLSCCGEHVCQSCVPENQPCPLCNERGAADSTWKDVLDDSKIVECPAEVSKLRKLRKRRGLSPEVEPKGKKLRSAKRKKVEPSFSISKELIKKQKIKSPRFYTSNGYLMEIEFYYKSVNGHQNQNNVHVSVYVHQGENDKDLCWPLTGRVQILLTDLGDTHYTSEISGTWEKPPPKTSCKGELDVPYEKLLEDRNGMLKFCVQLITD